MSHTVDPLTRTSSSTTTSVTTPLEETAAATTRAAESAQSGPSLLATPLESDSPDFFDVIDQSLEKAFHFYDQNDLPRAYLLFRKILIKIKANPLPEDSTLTVECLIGLVVTAPVDEQGLLLRAVMQEIERIRPQLQSEDEISARLSWYRPDLDLKLLISKERFLLRKLPALEEKERNNGILSALDSFVDLQATVFFLDERKSPPYELDHLILDYLNGISSYQFPPDISPLIEEKKKKCQELLDKLEEKRDFIAKKAALEREGKRPLPSREPTPTYARKVTPEQPNDGSNRLSRIFTLFAFAFLAGVLAGVAVALYRRNIVVPINPPLTL